MNIRGCFWQSNLFNAIRHENVEKVEELLVSQSQIVKPVSATAYSLLHFAIGHGPSSPAIVKLLLDKYPRLNLRRYYYPYLLNRAIKICKVETVELLLKRGIDPDAYNSLHLAIRLKKLDVVESLLNHGADANQLDDNGAKTPLHAALGRSNSFEFVELLVENGADVNCPDHMGTLPLAMALSKGPTMIDLLIKSGATINGRNSEGHTVLLAGLRKNYNVGRILNVVHYLVRLGADVKLADNKGKTALHVAAHGAFPKIVDCLLHYGADPNVADHKKRTPLYMSAIVECDKTAAHLLRYGARINERCVDGNTPLHAAVMVGLDSMVTFLLEHQADCTVKNDEGLTPFVLAVRRKNWLVAEEVVAYKFCMKEELSGDFELFSYCIEDFDDPFFGADARFLASKLVVKVIVGTVQNLAVNEIHLKAIEENEWLKTLRDGYVVDIESMKLKKFGESGCTYYDVLTRSIGQLASMARNKALADAFKAIDWPLSMLLREELYDKTEKALERRHLLDRTKRFCDEALNLLPSTCIDKVLGYLEGKDLERLIDVYRRGSWVYY